MYSVLKTSGTYADILLATGAAELIGRLGADDLVVSLIDSGSAFEIRCRPDWSHSPDRRVILLYPFVSLATGDDNGVLGTVIHYAAEKERKQETRKNALPRTERSKRKGRKSSLPSEIADAIADHEAINPEVGLVARLNEVDKGITVKRGNRLRAALSNIDEAGITAIQRALEVGWAPVREDLARRFDSETLGQALNPFAGKGTNRLKPDGARRENLEGAAVEEWLKFAGLYSHAYARRVSARDKSADIEILVPVPADIALDTAREVMKQLRGARIGGKSVKFEILAVLSYAEILTLHHRTKFAERLYRSRRLNKVVSGIQVAYFQDLGGGKSVTGLYTLGLPGWFDLQRPEDVEAYLTILEEHRRCLYPLDEKHSDEMGLLLRYRDFLSKEDLLDFLIFLVDHGEFVLKSWATGRSRPGRFSEEGLKHVVGGDRTMTMSEVVENDGFRSIARAIRRSTVSEIYWKTEKNDQIYEIRYGLGQDLKRRARRPDEFLAALASFVHSYDEENARVREQFSKRGKTLPAHRRRPDVSDVDLDAVVRLIETSENPEAVALLLVAYGFTRSHRDVEGENAGPSPTAG